MGIHNESSRAKKGIYESEMRRRLWWSLVLYDHRICELADSKATMLAPIWDCKIPLNVNDFDLRPDMKVLPTPYDQPSETLFVAVRSELGDFIRHSSFHLDFTNPSLKLVAGNSLSGSDAEDGGLAALEKSLQDKYLRLCNLENPVHFLTVWMTRAWLAKYRLFQYLCQYPHPSADQTEAVRNNSIKDAMSFLECDTKLTASPLTRRFTWLHELQFPMPAYIYLVQDLTKQPSKDGAELKWKVMSDNYEARFPVSNAEENLLLRALGKNVLEAWDALEVASAPQGVAFEVPHMVTDIKLAAMRRTQKAHIRRMQQRGETASMRSYDSAGHSNPSPMDSTCQSMLFGAGEQTFVDPTLGFYQTDLGSVQGSNAGLDMDMIDWNTILMQSQGW